MYNIGEFLGEAAAMLIVIAVFFIPIIIGLFAISLIITSIIAAINGDSALFMCQLFHWGCSQ